METTPCFKFGGPIEPLLFYDREKVIKSLTERLLEIKDGVQHNYALVGPRRVGKSSILRFLEEKLSEKGVIPVIIDCEGQDITKHLELTLEGFLDAYSGAVIDAFLMHANLQNKIKTRLKDLVMGARARIITELAETLGQVRALELKALSEYLNLRLEFEKISGKPSERELAKIVEDTLHLPEKLAAERDIYFVMLVDEFQYVAKFKPIPLLSRFRRHIQQQKRVSYVLSGSSLGMMEDILLVEPFGGHIPIEWIDNFSPAIAIKFLENGFQKAGHIISKENIRKIAEAVNNHPAYLNWFGEQCCRETEKGAPITSQLIADVEEKIFTQAGLMHIFERDIQKVSPRGGLPLQVFIEMAGHDLTSPTEIAKHIPRTTPPEVITFLKRLIKRGFVKRVEKGTYVIVDKMLGEYVKKKVHVT